MEAKQALEDCISAQDFSRAAELKDRISELEARRNQLVAEAAQSDSREKECRVEKVHTRAWLLLPNQSLACTFQKKYLWTGTFVSSFACQPDLDVTKVFKERPRNWHGNHLGYQTSFCKSLNSCL